MTNNEQRNSWSPFGRWGHIPSGNTAGPSQPQRGFPRRLSRQRYRGHDNLLTTFTNVAAPFGTSIPVAIPAQHTTVNRVSMVQSGVQERQMSVVDLGEQGKGPARHYLACPMLGNLGYDVSRIVDVKPQDLEEFTCGICLNVLRDPMVVQCCRTSYCKGCIEQWLESNDTCPNDRQQLTSAGLTPAPRLLINIVNNMKIRCERHSDGCPVVCTIGTEAEHRKTCKYYDCRRCGFRGQASTHDCVAYLLEVIDKLKMAEKDSWVTVDSDEVANSSKQLMRKAIEAARRNIDKFDYRTRSTWIKSNWLGDFVRISKRAIDNENDFEEITRTISIEINKKLNTGKVWHVVSFSTNGGSSSVCPENFISLNFSGLFIEIFEGCVKAP